MLTAKRFLVRCNDEHFQILKFLMSSTFSSCVGTLRCLIARGSGINGGGINGELEFSGKCN